MQPLHAIFLTFGVIIGCIGAGTAVIIIIIVINTENDDKGT